MTDEEIVRRILEEGAFLEYRRHRFLGEDLGGEWLLCEEVETIEALSAECAATIFEKLAAALRSTNA